MLYNCTLEPTVQNAFLCCDQLEENHDQQGFSFICLFYYDTSPRPLSIGSEKYRIDFRRTE